ncbi:lipoprotein [Paractinoplanes tereljensis]|uniref:Lipoprotein n=2 Tax=Paractinoplanes tereljensis TaxID=571912 RepID=A0A919NP36_9ACTN|nr:lipoprotein [Actinoplanes tereljensis]
MVFLLAGCGTAVRAEPPSAPPPTTATAARPKPKPAEVEITYTANGGRKFTVAEAEAGKKGTKGTLLRYHVAVERDIHGITAADFATTVTATLRDPRSWTGTGEWRLQRVGPADQADFTISLVTPKTRDALCDGAADGYTSCRSHDDVVINVARWVKGVPGYGASLDVYRQYVINHEVGHRLGQAHELCPAKGDPAPVMQQQTLGLHGCQPNPWPVRDGERYRGRIGAYDDPVPPRDRGLA